MIKVEFELRQAAAVRQALHLATAQDSYEFPSARTQELRDAISLLDAELEKHTM